MARGCNMGDIIYPNTTGQFTIPFNSDVEIFYNTNPITLRTWDNDPRCGIRDNVIYKTKERCYANGQYGAGIVIYNPADVSICHVPFDSNIMSFCTAVLLIIFTLKYKIHATN